MCPISEEGTSLGETGSDFLSVRVAYFFLGAALAAAACCCFF